MSQSIIEKLLKGAEVEWKPIDEIFTLKNGYTPSKSVKEYWIGGTVPWFRMEDLRAGERILKDSAQKVHINGVKGKLFPKDSIIMSTSATVGEHALILTDFLCNQRFTNFSVRGKYKTLLDIKYVYYYFFVIDKKAQENTSISSFPSVQMDKLKKWMFPIPPLSVQKEIVRILDAFTSHTAELTAELNQRKKQYNYYLNKLLTFSDDEVEWKSLGEMLKRTGGTSITAEKMKELNKANGALKIFAGGRTFAFADFNDIPEKDINKYPSIIVKSRGNIEFDYYDKPFSHKKEFWSYHSENDNIDIKYIYYYVKNKEQYFQHIGNKMQMPQISIRDTDIFLVPVPPISVQKEIVRKLDSFLTLITSISEGLPREIELRNKQFEYYREKLLDFPKPDLEN
ncbi:MULTISPECIES: restriction endonuclease subunit S [Bartonella]|uniref:restriction endonuclease subunit S n=1 Tax=Bartonella TaxID=773 RepID=UPI0018DE3300|nr:MULTISPECIES: restriction endonuclease subunit S [Bartonella]MBH9974900.1 restriction endonuclease subunit S [Bartonella choladocola]MBI0014506.1 restriction endonuclease subunit S [Bartonella sp. B10834G3]